MGDLEARLSLLIQQLYSTVRELEELCPGRKFTRDGHLVGSIGEAVARHRYGLELLPASSKDHDARALDGRLVQVKATQGAQIALYGEPHHLVVLRLERDGSSLEVYNGPGARVWARAGKLAKNGQRTVSLSTLRVLMTAVSETERLPLLLS